MPRNKIKYDGPACQFQCSESCVLLQEVLILLQGKETLNTSLFGIKLTQCNAKKCLIVKRSA